MTIPVTTLVIKREIKPRPRLGARFCRERGGGATWPGPDRRLLLAAVGVKFDGEDCQRRDAGRTAVRVVGSPRYAERRLPWPLVAPLTRRLTHGSALGLSSAPAAVEQQRSIAGSARAAILVVAHPVGDRVEEGEVHAALEMVLSPDYARSE